MTPAPPPPPPPAPAPTLNVSVNLPNKSALLKSIEKGTRLKKTVTNDRSAPLVGTQANNAASNASESRSSSSASSGMAAAATGMGGLFANGFPKLRSVGGDKAAGAKSSLADSVKASVATSAMKTAKTTVTENAKRLADDDVPKKQPSQAPPKPIAPQKTTVTAAPPPPLPKKAPKQPAKTSVEPDEIFGVQTTMSKASIKSERWSFADNVEETLPAPRKFTNCKKVYLSTQDSPSVSSSKGSGEEIGLEDIETFVEALNSKLKVAVADENFEECVRIKGKLKRFNTLKKKIEDGGKSLTIVQGVPINLTQSMSRVSIPELKKFMDKRISIQVNCNRKVTGVLRGFDAFMNIVLDETVEECKTGTLPMGTIVLRGNSILMIEALERIN